MSYKHAGEIGDVWKHLPLCDILGIENPRRYHETNSAYSGYTLERNPKTEYGVFSILCEKALYDCRYFSVLRSNGIWDKQYTGSPGLAMSILFDKSDYFFHDIESGALSDIMLSAQRKGVESRVKTFCGDSIQAFMKKEYMLNEEDFVFIDPYTPFDKNADGFHFFDVFEKAISCDSMTLLWYGYDNFENKEKISQKLKEIAILHNTGIYCFDVWSEGMTYGGECTVNPGVPGCGLACANLSKASLKKLGEYLRIVGNHYSNATYYDNNASLLTKSTAY